MANASRDENFVPTLLGASNADGVTPVAVKADPTTHVLETNDNTTGSDLSNEPSPRDDNYVVVAMAVSSVDGVTPVPIYADPATGKLLINSN